MTADRSPNRAVPLHRPHRAGDDVAVNAFGGWLIARRLMQGGEREGELVVARLDGDLFLQIRLFIPLAAG